MLPPLYRRSRNENSPLNLLGNLVIAVSNKTTAEGLIISNLQSILAVPNYGIQIRNWRFTFDWTAGHLELFRVVVDFIRLALKYTIE